MIFLGVLFVKQLLSLRGIARDRNGHGVWSRLSRFLPILLVVLTFVLVLSPYLIENKKLFGRYFYNVNSTFYVWYDSWSEVLSGTMAHGDTEGWPELPDSEIPTMSKYLQEHSSWQIVDRFKLGLKSQIQNIKKPYSLFNYPYIYSIALLVGVALNFSRMTKLALKYKYQILFSLLFFASNLFLFAWFAPIANYFDARFTYGLYVPYMYSVFLALYTISKEINWKINRVRLSLKGVGLFKAGNLLVAVLVIFEYIVHIPTAMTTGWFAK
jgi:hypothetical protein